VPPVLGPFPARFTGDRLKFHEIHSEKIIFYVFIGRFDEFPGGISLKNLK